MNGSVSKLARCAIYTRKSTEYNLELAFNSLDAQREACEAYIKSQAHEGWRLIPGRYDDGAVLSLVAAQEEVGSATPRFQNNSGLAQKCRTQARTSTCTVKRPHRVPLATKGFFRKCQKP
jgi:hypothetical protein